MAATGFHEQFVVTKERILWQHVVGPPDNIRSALQAKGFSLASYAEPNSSVRAEFDDYHRFYSARIFRLRFDDHGDRVCAQPLYVWANREIVLSWTPEPLAELGDVRKKLTENTEWVQSPERLVYYLFDEVLGSLFPFLDQINDRIAALEQHIFGRDQESHIQSRLFHLKREILQTRRILASMRDTISQLVRYWTANAPKDPFYYMELYDHMIRLFDTIDTYRELMNSVVDMHLSTVSNRLNEIVKTLTLVTTVLLPASLMAALYGMNFDYLPLAHYRWGFLVIMGVIGTISGSLYWIFRRRRWL